MSPPPILIVGAGPAGLTLARSLALRGRACRVFDATTRRPERGLGLWGRAQAALRMLGHGPLLDNVDTTLGSPAAAYRGRNGEWLSASSDTDYNRRRVSTLRESLLLADLERELPAGTVQRGAELVAVEDNGASSGTIGLRFADGSHADGSAVVGADGACSTVRQLAFGGAPCGAIDSGMYSFGGLLSPLAVANLVSSGGRTDSAKYSRPTAHAFETLSRGRRFACVPLADGDAFWFATLSEADLFKSAVAVGVDLRNDGGGELVLKALREAYDGFHSPIPRMLHAVACDVAEVAMSTSADKWGVSQTISQTIEASGVLRSERLHSAPGIGDWWAGRVVLVGDAAHAMPINLAQGAACAIEGAYLLGEALHHHGDHVERAFAQYQAAHEPRVRQCRAVTAFTELLARPASPIAEGFRNAMRFTPQPLNSMIFDATLSISLGDWPASTRARWPIDTHGGRQQ
jgi:FAD-dependent urate hydroxylase